MWQVVVGTFFTESRKPVGSSEVAAGVKPSGLAPVRTPPSIPMMQHMRMEVVDSMQDHMLGASGDGEVQPRVFQNVPLQAIDCFGSHFDGDTRGDTDPESTSPGGH